MVKKVAFIGAGSMAEAIIAGMINKKFLKNDQIHVANKDNEVRLEALTSKYGIIGSTNKQEVIKEADMIVLATKPADIESAIKDAKEFIQEDQLVISVIAGISTNFIESTIGKEVSVIRAMPNTSAAIGQSATAITKGKFANNDHLQVASELFEAIGTVTVVDEADMHVVTGISGSGPAYIYYLVEAMEKAAIEEGLSEEVAKQLINQTVIGAGNMLKQSAEPASVLKDNVTSPNGTTAAGIHTLSEYHFEEAVINCVKSATNRSIELGKE